ncbi:ABC-three component system protein [Acinetobacter terrae]|uniref:ABC-three component systems C-terminal domain-containing protein n=1 Tax=Acinetobacter terrae TaxID=2731247 RepID=A0A8E4FFT4_9GAMM|nr:ABC-three component system protein [Acinetobacter terrae]NNH39587.1 hypothetical protein [Acinetobacter terrae]
MIVNPTDNYSAGEQGLGYIYQPRFALLQLLKLPENTSFLIEKDDDLDFLDENGIKTLSSLKHKAIGDKLTDLNIDFWKSIRIWLTRYKRDDRINSNLRFFLFTTSSISPSSFLNKFSLEQMEKNSEQLDKVISEIEEAITKSQSKLIAAIATEFNELKNSEKSDFLSRVVIFDNSPRIIDIPSIIKNQYMRSIRSEFRNAIFERIEGWWNDLIIEQLSRVRTDAIYGYEISDKLHQIAEEYRSDNLPITFRERVPAQEIDVEKDNRLFVVQLREIGVSSSRIRNAILDYYRAFEQRSVWARENILISKEIENFEDRLVDEWSRYKDVVFEDLNEDTAEDVLIAAGKALYRWVDIDSGNIHSLRIRERVREPYVIRGGFHILANNKSNIRVYWHPNFMQRLSSILGTNI